MNQDLQSPDGTRELNNESDVEQKVLFGLLSSSPPLGFGFSSVEIRTKPALKSKMIGKGDGRRPFYPDYVVVLDGYPVLVVEAKRPSTDLSVAHGEARLYAAEINAEYPAGLNPCAHVIASDGELLRYSTWDTERPQIEFSLSEIDGVSKGLQQLLQACSREVCEAEIVAMNLALKPERYRRAVNLIGGDSSQNEVLPPNSFGQTIVGDYGPLFNPMQPTQRRKVVEEAYIASRRRERFVQPIDKVIRGSGLSANRDLKAVGDTARPDEFTKALSETEPSPNEVVLLIGSRGSGKSTFVDHLAYVALPDDLRVDLVWARLDLNHAPMELKGAYDWVCERLVDELGNALGDPYELESLERIFSVEINKLRRGAWHVLDQESNEFKSRLADELQRLQSDPQKMSRAMVRHFAERGKKVVVVLDNCDKRTSDEQLSVFQVAQWVLAEFRCLVVMPIRDVTYNLFRDQPPLDTAQKHLSFRIDPPQLADVLQARVRLVLREMEKSGGKRQRLSYTLENGIEVSYPAGEQEFYLVSMLRSLYAHGSFVRRVITGLAGRDVRKALEIFLDFCRSGHISENDVLRIRYAKGDYALSRQTVANVLLRSGRRFYSGAKSYVANVLWAEPDDLVPDFLVRVLLLDVLADWKGRKGPSGVRGFVPKKELVSELVFHGVSRQVAERELLELIRAEAVVAEHLRTDGVVDEDLVAITPSGLVHLEMMDLPEYMGAVSEDCYLPVGKEIEAISKELLRNDYLGQASVLRRADVLSSLLVEWGRSGPREPGSVLEGMGGRRETIVLRAREGLLRAAEEACCELFVGNVPYSATSGDLSDVLARAGVQVNDLELVSSGDGDGNKGFGFCTVGSGEDGLRLLACDGTLELGGRLLRIDLRQSSREGAQSRSGRSSRSAADPFRVYVKGFPPSFREAHCREFLAARGVLPAELIWLVPKKRRKEQPSSYGAVIARFESEEAASAAIGLLDGCETASGTLSAVPARPRRR